MKSLMIVLWCLVPTLAWAQEQVPETPVDDSYVEDGALRMLRLRLEACESQPRAECPAPVPAPAAPATLHGRVGVWGSHFGYTNPWALSDVSALTVLVGLDGVSAGAWLATGLSQTGLRYESTDFNQATHLASGWWQGRTLHLDATVGQLTTNDTDTDGTWLGALHGLWLAGAVGADLGVFTTRYPSRTVWQFDPQLVLVASPQFEAALGAEVIAFDAATRLSARAGVTWRPHPSLDLGLSGWAGRRQFAVEAGGMSVWSSDDVYRAGYRVALGWQFLPELALDAVWLHDFGNAQSSLRHGYQLLGGTLGVRAKF